MLLSCYDQDELGYYPVLMRFGSHVSIANHLFDAVDRAKAIGCEAMQIFPGNPRGWQASYFQTRDMEEFKRRRAAAGIRPLAVHLPYLVNIGSPVDRVFTASIGSIKDSLEKAKIVDADFLVMHVGSHVGAGRESGLERINAGLKEVLSSDFGRVKLLLENTAGAGFTLGDRLEEIAGIIDRTLQDTRLGVCLDTCHAYAAGYDVSDRQGLNDLLARFDDLMGLDRLGLIHANDSKSRLGSHIDRHEQIGRGFIGLDGWRNILSHPALKEKAFILETPRPQIGDDLRNLELLRSLAS